MRLRLIAFLLFLLPGFAGAAIAGEKPLVVVELYTSQGCSSCPPADALIEELADRPDVLALALHVDYWDYVGWADSFARPQFTARQKAYARMAHSSTIYTPQIVVGGIDQVVGFKPMKVAELLQRYGARVVPVDIATEVVGNRLRVNCRSSGANKLPGEMNVDLVGFRRSASVDILHGENAGKTITYANIVTSWKRLGRWDGAGIFEATIPEGNADHYALIVQAAGPGPVLAALKLR